MKIIITCYYGLADGILCAVNSLKKMGVEVIEYPLFKHYADAFDKMDDYVDHFNIFIKDNDPQVILWWYFSIPTSDMEKIINNNKLVKHIMFNWDEPFNWIHNDIQNKAKFFDAVFVTCEQRLNDYLTFGSKKAYLQFPGYDPLIHNMIIEENEADRLEYECDISICCTNLYEDSNKYPNQYIIRKQLVDDIYNNQAKLGYKFYIYGPEQFRNIYPDSYKGFISYENTNKVFNYSKINICTHVQANTYKYLNERVITVMGSGGLLYVDKVDGFDQIITPNTECIIIDKEQYLNQIVNILENYNNYYIVRYNAYQKSKLFTWDVWANNMVKNLE